MPSSRSPAWRASRCRPTGCGAGPTSSGCRGVVHVNLLDRERADFDAGARVADAPVRLGRRRGDADGPGARLRRRHRPRPHARLSRPERPARGRRRRDPGRVPGGGAAAPRRADREGRRVGRRADREVPRGRGDHGRGDGGGAEGDGLARHHVPGHVRRGDTQLRHARAARPDRRGAAVAEARRRRQGHQRRPARSSVLDLDDGIVAYVFKTIADPFAGKLSLFRVFSGTVTARRTCSTSAPTARSGWARCSRCRARTTTTPRSSRRARSAPSASSRT